MTIIANLDADIERFYAEQEEQTREIQIFGRVWPLVTAMTSITLAPLMQLQQAAQMVNDGRADASDPETRNAVFGFLGSANDIIGNVIREDVRAEFIVAANRKGFPLGILDKVIEAVMQVFDAAPFGSGTPTSPERQTPVPLHVSLSGSGNSPEGVGATSNPNSGHTPSPTTPPTPPAPVVPQGLTVAQWGQEPTLPAYSEDTALIPPSVQDVPHQ